MQQTKPVTSLPADEDTAGASAALRGLRGAHGSDSASLRAALFDALPYRDASDEMASAIAHAQARLRELKQSEREQHLHAQ